MNRLILVIVLIFLVGCSMNPKKNPTEKDISGTWESTGVAIFPYAAFLYDSEGKKEMVLLSKENGKTELESLSFESFTSFEDRFELTYIDENEEFDEPVILKGQVYRDQLLFIFEDEDTFEDAIYFWFIDSKQLDKYRKTVFDYMDISNK